MLAERATLRDLLHVDLELIPALGAQDDPFAHEAASFPVAPKRFHFTAYGSYYPIDGIRRDIHGKDGPDTMEARPRKGDGRGGTILLVEDSDVVREVIARMLDGGGFTVLQASCGEDALSISRSGDVSIDLILTDIVMPGMSGLELADLIEEERPGFPVLFMTGYSEEAVEGKSISGGNRKWIPKPFTQGEIVAKARKILSR